MSETWKFIEGSQSRNEMSKIVRENDEEFLIAYVLTDCHNAEVRKEDLLRGKLLTAAPDLLTIMKEIIATSLRKMNLAEPTDMELMDKMESVIAKAEGRQS